MVDKFPKDKIIEFREAFSFYDSRRDGTIDLRHIGRAIRCLGQCPTDSEVQEIINDLKKEGKSAIDFPEFLTIMAKMNQLANDKERRLKEAFASFDKAGKGYILCSELRHILTSLGNMTYQAIEKFLSEADGNNTGTINCEEFLAMMLNK